jgi:NAD(P)-dependent dehydrogenase (short-subunit alcohol dehydrogenase family)
MDSTRFSGRTALITGGTNGFGRATAELLIAGGARVLVTGRTATSIEETRATLGQRAVVVRSDAASLSDTVALADRARAELGELDLLFVNAGIARSASLAETDEAVYDEVFATNTRGVRHQHQRCLLHRAGTRSAHRRRRRRGDVDLGGERQGACP